LEPYIFILKCNYIFKKINTIIKMSDKKNKREYYKEYFSKEENRIRHNRIQAKSRLKRRIKTIENKIKKYQEEIILTRKKIENFKI